MIGPAMNEPAPLVTIVIPAHNCVDMTRTCLDSIRAHTEGSYEIILIDDASDPSASAAFKAMETTDLRVVRNASRRTFSANNNQAARLSQARYLCLLNNDTRVTPGWLSSMVAVAEREPGLAVLGNKHLFPQNDMLHHCGIGFDEKGFPVHLHPNTPPLTYAVNVQRDLQCVTFACVLIPRAAYEKLEGLDEAYRNGFEDCDFCLKARAAGYRIVYTPASTIYHHGQATPGRTDFDDENWKLFDSRWHGKLEHDLKPLLQSDRRVTRRELRARRRPRHGGDGFHFAVNVGEGSAFAWASAELIRELDAMGQTVSLDPSFGIHSSITGETRRVLRRAMRCRPCRTFHLKWSHYWEAYKRQPLSGEVNAEFFCTNYIYPPNTKQLDLWSKHVQVSSHRWLPISGFNKEVLTNLGVPDHRMRLAPLGYAPEIDRLLPETGLWQGVFPCNKIPTDWLEWIAEGLADLSRQPGLSTTAHSLFLQAAREAQKSVADPLVWKACQYIQAHWHETGLNIELIIEHLQTNRTTLSARFKAQTGKTILGYIADIRYRHAYQKIQQETTPIATIAQECGFLDASYFTQWFKKQAGQTPRSVRNGKK